MGKRKENSNRIVYPFILIVLLTLTCNYPGSESKPTPTETPSPVPDYEPVLAATSTLTPEIIITEEIKPTLSTPEKFDPCAPFPAPEEPILIVSNEADLRQNISTAASGTTILIEPGIYNLGDTILVSNPGITLRSTTGNRDDVILDGGGMISGHTHVILIEADDVTVADLTIRNGGEHGVSINGSDRPLLYNLHIYDTGYQLVKVNPIGEGSHEGVLACSRLEYTSTSPEEYTNGISAHNAHDWAVRDNQWYRIRTPGNTPAPTILFWSGSSNTIVERNLLVDCYQGIAFGNASGDPGDHFGGIVRNNFIYASQPHDSAIEMVHATGWLVAHNTVLLMNPDGVTWGMEARFEDTEGSFSYNLTNMDIWVNRDNAGAISLSNITDLQVEWLKNPTEGDLHLASQDLPPVDAASPLPEVSSDIDGEIRPIFDAPDIGADEFSLIEIHFPIIN